MSDPQQSQSRQSQSFGNINISGTNNQLAVAQSGRDSTIHQTDSEEAGEVSDLEIALEALRKLKDNISSTEQLNPVEKRQVEVVAQMLEQELQKQKPQKDLIDQTLDALKKGLQGVETLAGPVIQVAELVAKVWAGI